ncbi:MAG: hypothetical protein IK081_13915 [Lachnospiraceae bacterium]|nr:hypothetical protein [Lachnospiraceae bacterium]
MIDYSRELKEQLMEIKRLLVNVKKRRKAHEGLPEGSLRVTNSKGFPQYYFREKGTEKAVYVPAKDRAIIPKLIQREYENKAFIALEEAHRNMESFLKKYDPKCLDEIYDNLCTGRKEYVNPIAITDEEYVKQWMEENPGEQNSFPEQGKYETEQGEKVRSKSEKILADTFHKMKIPYCYEPKVLLNDHKVAYPDFACLNVRTRKTVYWEHLGLLNENEYASKNYLKIEAYEKSGILLGDKLLISMETAENPLDVSLIRRKIERFLT